MALLGREVAVIGAGVGGLAAALALAQRGARVTVVEQAAALGEVGAGLQLGPNSVAVIEALGLRDPVEAAASAPEAIELRDWRGGPVARVPLGATAVARYGLPYWQVHRADLLAALAAGAAEAGVRLVLGTRALGVEERGDRVRLALEGADPAEAEIVVAADGVRSGVRRALLAGAPPRFTGHVAWRGLVPAERLPRGALPAGPCVTMGPGRHLVTYPLRGGRLWNFVAVEERQAWADEGWSVAGDPQELRAAFAGIWPGAAALLSAIDETFLWGLFDHPPLAAWTRGRVALLGDAAHPMLPFLAQGAAMALEDAWVLASTLAAGDGAEGLAAYEDRRRARATRVQRAAARNGRVWHLRAPLARAAVDLALRAATAAAPDRLLARFDWLYGANVVGMAPTD